MATHSLRAMRSVLLGLLLASSSEGLAPKELSRRQFLPALSILLSSAPAQAVPTCPRDSSPCISTTSVRQVDKFLSPWTYPESYAPEQVIAAIQAALDPSCRVLEGSSNSLVVEAKRAFAVDRIEFLVQDNVVQFTSQQVEGPGDFNGTNRQRLLDLRKRAKIFTSEADYEAEGALQQLKSFYGLQSGSGFEDVLLNNDE